MIGSKFTPKRDDSYVVCEVYSNGAYKIVVTKGVLVGPINGKFLKRFILEKLFGISYA